MSSTDYFDSCPECDSLKVVALHDKVKEGVWYMNCHCQECGAEWVDFEELTND